MKMECVICKKKILEDDSYFKVELFKNAESKGADYAHQDCWINRNQTNEKIRQLGEGALKLLKSDEVKERMEEVIIK